MKKAQALLLLAATSCADNAFNTINTEMPKYGDKPIDFVVAKLGVPTGEQLIMGRKVYIWSTSFADNSPSPVANSGYVGSTAVALTSFGSSSSASLTCTLRVTVDDQNRVTHYDYAGNNGACATYAKRLKS